MSRFGQFGAAAQVDAPGVDFPAHSLEGVLAGRGQEGAEHRAVSLPGRGLPGAERVAEESERRFRAVFAPPVPVLAVHDPGLVRVQLQPDFGHPFFQGSEDLAGLLPRRAVHHGVVGVTLELDRRELPFEPFVERVVHEQVGEHRTRA